MARLLSDHDYLRLIQDANLQQIIDNTQQYMLDAEQAAQSEMIGYLAQRYKTADIFTNTTQFDVTATYKAKNLVYLNADAFSDTTTYITGDLVVQNGKVYHSTAGSAPVAFDPTDWDLLGNQYAFFHVTLPEAEYDLDTTYQIGDVVWYADRTYTAIKANTGVLPTDAVIWTQGAVYSISGDLVTDTAVWTAGDNRNQLIVLHLINITLYWLHHRINPRNVPDHRKIAYDGNGDIKNAGSALNWLTMVAGGDINADIPEVQPQQGMSIRYGSANDATTISRNSLW